MKQDVFRRLWLRPNYWRILVLFRQISTGGIYIGCSPKLVSKDQRTGSHIVASIVCSNYKNPSFADQSIVGPFTIPGLAAILPGRLAIDTIFQLKV